MSSLSSEDRLNQIRQSLKASIGEHIFRDDPAVCARHAGDWSEIPNLQPDMVVFPATCGQVAQILAACDAVGQPVVIQGGLTGLAGGATPKPQELVISLSKMNEIERVDSLGGVVRVQAGVTLQALQEHLHPLGWAFPLDLGARGSCQLGGNAATNAGGNRVIRYGTMRPQVLGLEVVLPDGTILDMLDQTTKNTTGIDLKQLFIGAEGTLGVITRLVLKLSPLPKATQTIMCALASFSDAAVFLKELRAAFPGLSAYELMWDEFMTAACEACSSSFPFSERYPLYALVEVQGGDESHDRQALESFLGSALENEWIADAILANSIADTVKLWAQRESVSELLSLYKPCLAFDVGVPMSATGELVQELENRLSELYPNARHLFFGHLGDGNLHLLSGPYSDADRHSAEELVYQLVAQAGGCVSAEHGIGVLKRPYLHFSRDGVQIEIMRRIKECLDPGNILNQGRVF